MAENYEDSAKWTSGECPKKECPKSPEQVETPNYPKGYYEEKIPKDKLEALNAVKKEKDESADEEKKKAIAIAEKAKHTAKMAYEAAEMDYKSAQTMLDLKTANRKGKLRRDYSQCLFDALPKNCPGSGDMDIGDDPRVPPDKKAVCIAQFASGLANEEVTYLTDLWNISKAWLEAASSWKTAQESYEAAKCMADAVEKKALRTADMEWRKEISKELEKICK